MYRHNHQREHDMSDELLSCYLGSAGVTIIREGDGTLNDVSIDTVLRSDDTDDMLAALLGDLSTRLQTGVRQHDTHNEERGKRYLPGDSCHSVPPRCSDGRPW